VEILLQYISYTRQEMHEISFVREDCAAVGLKPIRRRTHQNKSSTEHNPDRMKSSQKPPEWKPSRTKRKTGDRSW